MKTTKSNFYLVQKLLVFVVLMLPKLVAGQSLETYFQNKLDSLYDLNKDAIGVMMHIESPGKNISWTAAVGLSDREAGHPLNANQPVLIASNTKPYVAAAVLRLAEMGKLELDQSIQSLLPRKYIRWFAKDGYDFNKVTIKHLLSHTSGIADYVDDEYFNLVNENPLKKWKKKQQIKRSIIVGDPLFEPGADFKYGDINYLLLTEIIERKTDQPFYVAMRDLLKFDELNLNHTWFKGLESYPNNTQSMAHQYSEKRKWNSYDMNPSWDLYGGGGLAATIKDAALFFQYLFEGKIISDKAVLAEAYTLVLPEEQSKYGLGFNKFTFPTFIAYYHGGWWGTDVAYSPDSNSSVAVFTLQKAKRGEFAKLSIEFMKTLAQ